jgi:hypothetical protein
MVRVHVYSRAMHILHAAHAFIECAVLLLLFQISCCQPLLLVRKHEHYHIVTVANLENSGALCCARAALRFYACIVFFDVRCVINATYLSDDQHVVTCLQYFRKVSRLFHETAKICCQPDSAGYTTGSDDGRVCASLPRQPIVFILSGVGCRRCCVVCVHWSAC